MKRTLSATTRAISLALLLVGTQAWAAEPKTFDTVSEMLAVARKGKINGNFVFIRKALVTTDVTGDADSEEGLVEFLVQDSPDGEAVRIEIETYYMGYNPFLEEDDNPYDTEIDLEVERGDLVTVGGRLGYDHDKSVYYLERSLEDDLWDDALYEVYVEGFHLEDWAQVISILVGNSYIDVIDDFRMDHYAENSDLAQFNKYLKQLGVEEVHSLDDIAERLDWAYGVNQGIRAVVTVHGSGTVPPPADLTPSVAYMRPYTRLTQGSITLIKVNRAGVGPELKLGRRKLTLLGNEGGLLVTQIPMKTKPGLYNLTVTNQQSGNKSRKFRVWVRRAVPPERPLPVLATATVMVAPGGSPAMLVLEGRHFAISPEEVRVYLGRQRLPAVMNHDNNTVLAIIPAGIRGTKARVRVGSRRSNSVTVRGLRFLDQGQSSPTGQGSGVNNVIGGKLGD